MNEEGVMLGPPKSPTYFLTCGVWNFQEAWENFQEDNTNQILTKYICEEVWTKTITSKGCV